MVNFADLKKNRQNNFAKLVEKTEALESKQFTKDERFWQPTVDKSGSGYAIIRFLPEFGEEESPYVRVFEHGFKGPTGQWYIENSRSTLGDKEADPAMEFNSKLWNSTEDDKHPNREQARAQKRKLNFISNIYVISDPAAPENNGTVRLFKYGKKIFDKIKAVMTPDPQFADEKPMNPYDLWDGADFKLKIRKVDGYRNYDKSEFDDPTPLFDNDAKIEVVYNKIVSLKEFIDPKNFKSYDELKARLDLVLGINTGSAKIAKSNPMDEPADETPFSGGRHTSEPRSAPSRELNTSVPDDGEDDDAFFQNLLKE